MERKSFGSFRSIDSLVVRVGVREPELKEGKMVRKGVISCDSNKCSGLKRWICCFVRDDHGNILLEDNIWPAQTPKWDSEGRTYHPACPKVSTSVEE